LIFRPANPDELQIDLDRPFFYTCTLWWSKRYQPPAWWPRRATTSRNGRIHLSVALGADLGPMQRVTLQAGYGSDPWREKMNAERIRNRAPHPILFFEK